MNPNLLYMIAGAFFSEWAAKIYAMIMIHYGYQP